MASIIATVFAVVVVGGAAALGYAIYLSSGFIEPERRAPDRSF
jgi:hypothetical protein